MRKLVSFTVGSRFGSLVVINPCIERDKHGNAKGLFRCDCGIEKTIYVNGVKHGLVRSCGCFSAKNTSERFRTHGMSGSAIYHVWDAIKDRCLNERSIGYSNYGGRGICLCDRWMSFDNFYADMGEGWRRGLQIDRIDNDGNYEPSNCRWVTRQVNANNTRRNRFIEYNGVQGTVAQVARVLGIPYPTLSYKTRR